MLQRLGAQHAMVVWGRDNMDEVSLGAATMVGELVDGADPRIRNPSGRLRPADDRQPQPEGGGRGGVEGRRCWKRCDNEPGPARDIVALNAGTALYAAGVAASIGDGMAMAREAIASGAARAKLEQFVSATRELGGA